MCDTHAYEVTYPSYVCFRTAISALSVQISAVPLNCDCGMLSSALASHQHQGAIRTHHGLGLVCRPPTAVFAEFPSAGT